MARPSATEAAARFATITVARWVGWREELSAPSIHSFRRANPPRALREPCERALGALLEQQRTGYREAVHRMTVPRLEGDHVRLETHPAIGFQRAVALDGLQDAYAAGLDVPVSVLAQEALRLLRAKRDDVRGGWSSLPDVAELPPDVDDLAMMLLVLSRCGGQPLAAACDQAVELVLAAAGRWTTSGRPATRGQLARLPLPSPSPAWTAPESTSTAAAPSPPAFASRPSWQAGAPMPAGA